MKAVLLKNTGGVENLSVEEIERPSYGKNEVLVRVKAFSLNPIDVKTRKGNHFSEKLLGDKPSIPGWDMSGIIEEIGDEVTEFNEKTKVFGMLNFPELGKTYAEYVVAKPEDLVEIPENTNFLEAGATPLAALTAYQALHNHAKLGKGKKILILAAGGGVGHFGVQIANYFGAEVIATCSKDKKEFVQGLGAHQVIDYKSANFEDELDSVDVVFDLLGGSYIEDSLRVLKKGGTIISIPSASNKGVAEKAEEAGCKGLAFKVGRNKEDLEAIAALIAKNRLKPFVSKTFDLSEIREAQTELEKGHTQGKIVVTST